MLNTPFDIPKEIRTKPKMLGLEVKELLMLGLIALATLTFLKDMVHGLFTIPFYLTVGGVSVFLLSPSSNNPLKKNYHSMIMYLKRNKSHYPPIDVNTEKNKKLYDYIEKQNNELLDKQYYESVDDKDKTSEEILMKDYIEEGGDFDEFEKEVEQERVLVPSSEQMVLQSGKSFNSNKTKKDKKQSNVKHDLINKHKDKKATGKNETDIEPEKLESEPEKTVIKEKKDSTTLKQKAKKVTKNKKPKKPLDISNKIKKGFKGSFKKPFIVPISTVILLMIVLFTLNPFNLEYSLGQNADEEVQDEELVSALRSFSLKEYDKSIEHFNNIDYNSLEDDDKDVMLLSYLFGNKPEKAIELEPDFDEVVVSYYKTSFDMESLRELAENIDSKPINFEIAVSDGDKEKILELKDSVKIKDERGVVIVNTLLEEEDLASSNKFVEGVEDEEVRAELEEMNKEYGKLKKEALEEEEAKKSKEKKED